MSGLDVAFIGQRGVPATYGGIEHHVEEIGARLVERGHRVTVYCRTNYTPYRPATHLGMRLRYVPTVGTKHLDAIVHSGLSSALAVRKGYDVIHYQAIGPGVTAPLARWGARATVVLTIHGRDHERAKWSPTAQRALRAADWTGTRSAHAIVGVSRDLAKSYAHTGKLVEYIPNGVTRPPKRPPGAVLASLGLEPGRYVLFVGRLVPEKAPHDLVAAFAGLHGDVKLVLVGGTSFSDEYVEMLRERAARDSRVCLAGYRYVEELEELYSNAAVFVLPSILEGLPLTLLEALSHGLPVLASRIPPHQEVLGSEASGGRTFPAGDVPALRAALRRILEDIGGERQGGADLRARTLLAYDWDDAAASTEALYLRAITEAGRAPMVTGPRASTGDT